MPTISAATSMSRTAIQARPKRLRIRFQEKKTKTASKTSATR